MKATKAQIRKMINTMEVKHIDLKPVETEVQEIDIPLQTLFDNCLNFISGEDAFKNITF